MIYQGSRKTKIECKLRVISGPEYGWAMKMMSHSFTCKNKDFDGPFEILMGHLEKNGPKKP